MRIIKRGAYTLGPGDVFRHPEGFDFHVLHVRFATPEVVELKGRNESNGRIRTENFETKTRLQVLNDRGPELIDTKGYVVDAIDVQIGDVIEIFHLSGGRRKVTNVTTSRNRNTRFIDLDSGRSEELSLHQPVRLYNRIPEIMDMSKTRLTNGAKKILSEDDTALDTIATIIKRHAQMDYGSASKECVRNNKSALAERSGGTVRGRYGDLVVDVYYERGVVSERTIASNGEVGSL